MTPIGATRSHAPASTADQLEPGRREPVEPSPAGPDHYVVEDRGEDRVLPDGTIRPTRLGHSAATL